MRTKITASLSQKFKTTLVKNSFWGILSNILQNILYSVFFIVVARKYSTSDFANYILANTLYAFVAAFSALGLGQWFIRELMETEDKTNLTNKFFKMQLYVGVFFYAINIVLSYVLYQHQLIRSLSLLIGINVIFDNIIYVITNINIANLEQKKNFIIITVEAFLKFLIACTLFIFPIPVVYLAVILILLRFITLNLFIRIGTSNSIHLGEILKTKIDTAGIKEIIASNWSFIIIGSVSIIHWRIGNILASKVLTMADVAHFEISYKLFSMAVILPVIVSSSLYPVLIKSFSRGINELQTIYKKAFVAYTLYGMLAFTFIYSFSGIIIPFLFGDKYLDTSGYCKEMFLTTLVCPTVLLQANLLITMKLEKLDMWFNIVCLAFCLLLCGIGLYYVKSLSIINYAIFTSFVLFHIIQDAALVRRKILTLQHAIAFYIIIGSVYILYTLLANYMNAFFLFIGFWTIIAMVSVAVVFAKRIPDALTLNKQNI